MKKLKQGKAIKLVQPIAHGLYHTISCHWLLIPSGMDTQTDRQTHIPTCDHEPKQLKETRCARPSAMYIWFKKELGITVASLETIN